MSGRRTIDATLRDAARRLEAAGVDAPRIQATALLGHALQIDRAPLLASLSDMVDAETANAFDALIELRCARCPLQYLIGRASFLDFEVRVGPGVFIPRPETEQLAEKALRLWAPAHPRVIDVGTGSGVIAIALARADRRCRVLALDLSPTALAAAAANAIDNGVEHQITFVRSDLLSAIRLRPSCVDIGLLVSNPPYVRPDDVVQPEVRDHEPVAAWAAGPLGTEIYARLIPQAAERLDSRCPMLLELGCGQAEAISDLLQSDGRWLGSQVDPDFQSIPRVLCVRRR